MKKKRLFYQYLFSYLCIFLFPLTLVSVMVYGRTVKSARESVMNDNKDALMRARDVIELQMNRLSNARDVLNVDKLFANFDFEADTVKAMEIQEKLKLSASLTPFVYDIIFYQGRGNYVIGTHSSGTINNYSRHMYQYTGMDREQVENQLRQASESDLWPACGVKPIWAKEIKLLTYILPFRTSLGKYEGEKLIFLLPEDTFSVLLEDACVENGAAYIMDKNGQLLVALGEEDVILGASELESRAAIEQIGSGTVSLNGKKYAVNRVESQQFPWSYVSLIPVSEITASAGNMWYYVFFTAFLAVIVGGGLIYYFMRKNYIPIYNLQEYAGQVMQMSQVDREDIGTIRQVMAAITVQNRGLQEAVRKQEPGCQEYLLRKMLTSPDSLDREFMKAAEAANLRFDHKNFMAVIWQFGKASVKNPGELPGALRDMSLDWITIHSFYDEGERCLNLIVCFAARKEHQAVNYLKYALENLSREYPLACMIGLGQTAASPKDIARSYQEAKEAARYGILTGYGEWNAYEQIKDRTKNVYLQYSGLRSAILHQRSGEADTILADMKRRLAEPGVSVDSILENCTELVYMLGRCFRELQSETEQWSRPEYNTVEELFRKASEQIHRMMMNYTARKQQEKDVFQNILDYIRENITSYDLTASSVAEKFSMSVSYLSQYFKVRQGCTVLDYITELKIEEAKKILTATELPISQVSEQVGFGNEKSFARRFKQVTGMTPSEWRKHYSA